eukprot:1157381-Pelagomonas_calceolata.AAC.1
MAWLVCAVLPKSLLAGATHPVACVYIHFLDNVTLRDNTLLDFVNSCHPLAVLAHACPFKTPAHPYTAQIDQIALCCTRQGQIVSHLTANLKITLLDVMHSTAVKDPG